METKRTLPTESSRLIARLAIFLVISVLAAGCSLSGRPSMSSTEPVEGGDPTATHRPTITLTPTPTPWPWPTFEVPYGGDPTPAPEVASRVSLPEGTRVWLFLGAEDQKPTRGRTNAIHLLLVNERLSKASIISIPGSTFVYLPGQGMGRVNTAYALGGMKLVSDTLVYNFGLRPDRFVVAHETEFVWLVDDLDRLEVSVLLPIRDDCGGLPAGLHTMDGKRVLCYISYKGDDEINRTRRQQQVLQLLFTKLVQQGRMAKLPFMYASYDEYLDTDVSLLDLLTRVPLALRLGDPDRIKGFVLGWEQLKSWELPDLTRTSVLLPREGKIEILVRQAVEAISEPSALNAVVLTYEAQLTQVIGVTRTYEAYQTQIMRPTNSPTPDVFVPTPTAFVPGSPTPVTPGVTPLPSNTPTATQTATVPIPQTPSPTPRPQPTSEDPYPVPTASFDTVTPPYP